jgi:formate-dependent nitrite reductase membrane component NrfD
MGIGLAGSNVDMASAEMWSRITIVVNAFIIIIYLVSAASSSTVGKLSVKELIVGRVAVVFWAGLIGLGIMMPLAISISSLYAGTEASSVMLITAITCHTIGAFSLKYCLLKAGIHQPIITKVRAN